MEFTIGLAQMTIVCDRPEQNEATVREIARQACAQGVELLVLPELWPYGYNLERAAEYAAPLEEGPFALMAELADHHKLYLVGTALETNPVGRPYNTAALFDPDGHLSAVYRKVHLFPPMGELEHLSAGQSLPTFDLPWGRTALAICYDLRFPEMWRTYADQGVQLILIAAEWPLSRVEHWRLLLRARAVENQLFVAGCNRAGQDADGLFGGRSAAVDPLGRVLVEGGEVPELLVATLDLAEVAAVRQRFPFLNDRRPAVYRPPAPEPPPRQAYDHETYLSPLTWRYGSDEMRRIWSEGHKRRLWRRIWVALAESQVEFGLVTPEQAADLRSHADDLNLERSRQLEAEIQHDLMAEIRAFAEQCPLGGGIIHLGATSMDVKDNADVLCLRQALDLLLDRLRVLLATLADRIEERADQACMGYTHLQPAEPTTVGYRLAQYGLDLLLDLGELQRLRDGLKGKGLKGATGTSASYVQLLALPDGEGEAEQRARDLEAHFLARLGLEAFPVATQTYPRKQDWLVLNALAGLAGSLYKFAFDLRLLQAQPFGEWSEPFGRRQVGSSAMPFKRNPVGAENIDSLARLVASLPRVAWDNAAHSLLERTLDDSGNRRFILPQAFLLTEETVRRSQRILEGLVIVEGMVRRNLALYGPFAATERLLMELVKAGADRQAMHELIRQHSLAAWEAIQRGEPNPLLDRLAREPQVLDRLPATRVRELMDASRYVGDAPHRARELAVAIRRALA